MFIFERIGVAMRKYLFLMTAILVSLLFATSSFAAETQTQTEAFGKGQVRYYASSGGFKLAGDLASQYETEPVDGIVYYTPEAPKPLCILMVAHPDCQIGINHDDIYYVSEKGFTSTSSGFPAYTNPGAQINWSNALGTNNRDNDTMTNRMWTWRRLIEDESKGMLMFVTDPNEADILITVNQTYPFYADYYGGGRTVKGHSCRVEMTACQLTNPSNIVSVVRQKDPEDSVTTSGGSIFWKNPPDFEGSLQITELVQAMLGWYGYNADLGSYGPGVALAQSTMINRGFLEGTADGSFGPMTAEAVKRVQEYYGLEQTGSIDRTSLIAIYYEPVIVDNMLENYP